MWVCGSMMRRVLCQSLVLWLDQEGGVCSGVVTLMALRYRVAVWWHRGRAWQPARRCSRRLAVLSTSPRCQPQAQGLPSPERSTSTLCAVSPQPLPPPTRSPRPPSHPHPPTRPPPVHCPKCRTPQVGPAVVEEVAEPPSTSGRISIWCTASGYDLEALRAHLETQGYQCKQYPEVLHSRCVCGGGLGRGGSGSGAGPLNTLRGCHSTGGGVGSAGLAVQPAPPEVLHTAGGGEG